MSILQLNNLIVKFERLTFGREVAHAHNSTLCLCWCLENINYLIESRDFIIFHHQQIKNTSFVGEEIVVILYLNVYPKNNF